MKRGTAQSSSPGGCTKETLRVRVIGNSVNRVLFSFRKANANVDRVHSDGYYVFERSVKGLKRGTYRVSAKAFFSDRSKPTQMTERVFICPKSSPQFTG